MTCAVCGGAIDRSRDLRWVKDGHAILLCPTCGVLERADLPAEEELEGLYLDDYFFSSAGDVGAQGYADYLREEPNHRAVARRRLRMLARYVTPGAVLDVGCAAGFFADEAQRQGWRAEGVELSATMAEHARSLGVTVHEGLFAAADLPAESVDAVTMWDYIEHATDPVDDLRRAAALLRPGGIVALSTGDASSLAARLTGRRWHLLTPRHHNFFFTPGAIRTALARAGFVPLRVSHPGGIYSVAYLSHKLGTLVDVGSLKVAATGRAGRVAVPLNLFDIMTVVARRGGQPTGTTRPASTSASARPGAGS